VGTVNFDFKGEVVVVTGGSRGLGLEIAQAFGAAGATVVITARRTQWLHEAAQQLQGQGVIVHAMVCDVADPSSVEQVVGKILETCGKIDVLVNNAGLTWGAPAETMPFERWKQVIDANITGTFLMSQIAGRNMLERQKGAIVNVASIAGLGGGQLQTVGYNSSKAAVINLTRSLAVEWAKQGIRVNCIAPGMIATARIIQNVLPGSIDANRDFAELISLRRLGTVEDCAKVMEFLATDLSDYVTGAVIPVDGGLMR